MQGQSFDTLAVAVLDFKKKSWDGFEIHQDQFISPVHFFDLASVTKMLTIGTSYILSPDLFCQETILTSEHRAGLPAWGRLDKDTWREEVSSFPLFSSDTLYSDFSALRAMMLLEKKMNMSVYDLASRAWADGVYHWTELPASCQCPKTGTRNGRAIVGEVHDDNAFIIRDKVSHAGLFASLDGICNTVLNLDSKHQLIMKVTSLISQMNKELPSQRFVRGFDRVLDLDGTLAGKGASALSFGHLGFTGTSMWIDPDKGLGHIILSNATQNYWYAKDGLNSLRRNIGSFIWKNF